MQTGNLSFIESLAKDQDTLYRVHNTFAYRVDYGIYECILPCGFLADMEIPGWYEPKASDTYLFAEKCRPADISEVQRWLQWWCESVQLHPFIVVKNCLYYPHQLKNNLVEDFYIVDGFRLHKAVCDTICTVCKT